MALFFVHIPKTAGTSFRLGAEQYFSPERVFYDYGVDSAKSSSLVRELLYVDQPDFWQFKQALLAEGPAMLAGHVPVQRFVSLLGVENTLTFLREPLQRIASEYAHFVRHMNYKGSFREFYSHPRMHNRQKRALHGVNIESLGLVGLTERYSESIEMLNSHFGLRIPKRRDNRGKGFLQKEHLLEQGDIDEIQRLNKEDILLYRHATALFDARYSLFKAHQPWVHGRIVRANTQRISGFAWWAQDSRKCLNDQAVDVEIWVNGELTSTLSASEFCPTLCQLMPPRGGYVGFERSVKLNPDDRVQCRVAATGQWFPPQPRRVVAHKK